MSDESQLLAPHPKLKGLEKGREGKGSEGKGREGKGKERKGKERKGKERKGKERKDSAMQWRSIRETSM